MRDDIRRTNLEGEMLMDKNIWLSGIMGVVVGDALGTPVQFFSREEVKEKNVTGMIGYGTFNLPEGSWTDDSSLTLATLSSIKAHGKIDSKDIAERFAWWYEDGKYTPYGYPYDIGNTCDEAISRYRDEREHLTCGCNDEYSNGNGSLMRIMPACLSVFEQEKTGEISEKEALDLVHEVSALTHAHLRSKMTCGFYYFMVKAILEEDKTLQECLQKGVDDAVRFYHEKMENLVQLAYFGRLFHLEELAGTPEANIKSSGYVIDSIEAAVWCLVTTGNYADATLKAVNLGKDTDTIAAIAGGLAGLYYGYESIPEEWKKVIVKRDWIEELCDFSHKKEDIYVGPVADNHCHILPGIDDGATDMEMSIKMLRVAEQEGVRDLVLTPHGDYVCEEVEYYHDTYDKLVERAKEEGIAIKLYKGCEVFCELSSLEFEGDNDDMKPVIYALDDGSYPTYNETKYMLMEFYIWVQPAEALYMVKRIQSGGYTPIIAHAERYPYLVENYFIDVLVREGCLIQINSYSLVEEKTAQFKTNARYLLGRGLVHFLGSDAHKSDHRPPRMNKGVQYVWENCDENYAKNVIYRNAYRKLYGTSPV